jgi:hypothetical protein
LIAWWARLLCIALAGGGSFGATTPPRVEADPFDRSIERLRYECFNSFSRREVTLFANGTIRLREGMKSTPTMSLGELTRDELLAVLESLGEIDFTEAEAATQGVRGEWVEQCRLQLDLPAAPERVFNFARYDTRPPAVERAVRAAEDLARRVQPVGRAEHLPIGYEAKAGDVLRRVDGRLFRVIGESQDKIGLELDSVDSALRLFIAKGGLNLEFDRLVSRLDVMGRDRPYLEEP